MAWTRLKNHTYTDNDEANLGAKVDLRIEAVESLGEPRHIHVLDAFHGDGVVWSLVKDQLPPGWIVQLYRADYENHAAGTLKVDNVRLLEVIDLNRFDLIDLDAYGYPDKQLRIIAARAPQIPVVMTTIWRAWGMVPNAVSRDLGFKFPKGYAKTLVATVGEELWVAWLYQRGYRQTRMIRFTHSIGVGGTVHNPNSRQVVKRYEVVGRRSRHRGSFAGVGRRWPMTWMRSAARTAATNRPPMSD